MGASVHRGRRSTLTKLLSQLAGVRPTHGRRAHDPVQSSSASILDRPRPGVPRGSFFSNGGCEFQVLDKTTTKQPITVDPHTPLGSSSLELLLVTLKVRWLSLAQYT